MSDYDYWKLQNALDVEDEAKEEEKKRQIQDNCNIEYLNDIKDLTKGIFNA